MPLLQRETVPMSDSQRDKVGLWTEVKLDILREYSGAYARILHKQPAIRHYAYIDGFAGAGTHVSRTSGLEIPGSPSIALQADPAFSHYHFIDLDGKRVTLLKNLAEGRDDVSVYQGDCNERLLHDVFPTCRYEEYRRALCVLDPYDLNPKWRVVETAARMKSVEIFLNFMLMDANMNVLWKNPEHVDPEQVDRMNAFWGDDSWRQIAYKSEQGLLGPLMEKAPNREVAIAYQIRLRNVAGFRYVPEPVPMRNSRGAVVYYLFFASHNKTGGRIAADIFRKYREQGGISVE